MSTPVALGPRLTSTGTGAASFTGAASGAGAALVVDDVPPLLVGAGVGAGVGALPPPPPQATRNKDKSSTGPMRHTQLCASDVLETRYPQPSCNCGLTIAELWPGT
jgi:hypothetical protein